jgi:hypothetical protein
MIISALIIVDNTGLNSCLEKQNKRQYTYSLPLVGSQ